MIISNSSLLIKLNRPNYTNIGTEIDNKNYFKLTQNINFTRLLHGGTVKTASFPAIDDSDVMIGRRESET